MPVLLTKGNSSLGYAGKVGMEFLEAAAERFSAKMAGVKTGEQFAGRR